MDWRYNLLRIDSFGGLIVGLVMLLLSNWLPEWYGLSRGFILLIALANLAYGCYSFSLLIRNKRPLSLIILLVIANLVWAVLCVRWAIIHAQTATFFGMAHLIGEAVFVGALAILEWCYRRLLVSSFR